MPKPITMKWDSRSRAGFEDLLQEMVEVTGRDAKTVVRNTGRDLYFALMRETPQSKSTISGRRINTFGFAKAGWFSSAKGLKITALRSKAHLRGGRKGEISGDFRDELKRRGRPQVTLVNSVPYIEELPGLILPIAISKTETKLRRTLTNISRRGWRSTWKR